MMRHRMRHSILNTRNQVALNLRQNNLQTDQTHETVRHTVTVLAEFERHGENRDRTPTESPSWFPFPARSARYGGRTFTVAQDLTLREEFEQFKSATALASTRNARKRPIREQIKSGRNA